MVLLVNSFHVGLKVPAPKKSFATMGAKLVLNFVMNLPSMFGQFGSRFKSQMAMFAIKVHVTVICGKMFLQSPLGLVSFGTLWAMVQPIL